MTPLSGVRVLDLSRLIPGPFATLVLADLGATVDKVEDTGGGDYMRHTPPQIAGEAGSFHALNRGKRSIVLDLKKKEGQAALLRILSGYDVLFEQFRPGVLDRLGLSHASLREKFPKLIICALTGYGQTGPLAHRAGHDLNYLARAGLLGFMGPTDAPPTVPGFQLADVSGGMWAVISILAALRERDRSGEGQLVDVSMADGALSWLAMTAANYLADGDVPRRGHIPLGGMFVCYRPYACADGHVTFGALEPKFFQNFCRGVGREDLIEHQFQSPGSDTHRELEAIFAGRTRDEWAAFASEHDCCLEPVLELDEVLDSDLVREREMVVEIDQPGADRPVRQLGVPVKLSRTPGDPRRLPGPGLGEHTAAVLRDAGYTDAQIADLTDAGAIGVLAEGATGSFLT